MNPAIRCVNLQKTFDPSRGPVLQGLNVDISEGKLTYILGPSGTGKSVLLKTILGLIEPDLGTIEVFGKTVSSHWTRDHWVEYRKQFGMLFQNSALFDDFTVFENVAFPLNEHEDITDEETEERVMNILAKLSLTKAAHQRPSELSGGMRKRAAMARAIIREPLILLYDEPTTGLDAIMRETVDEMIESLKRTLTLTSLVVSHDIPSALRLADEIIFLAHGRALFHGSSSGFLASPDPLIQETLESERHSLQSARDLWKSC